MAQKSKAWALSVVVDALRMVAKNEHRTLLGDSKRIDEIEPAFEVVDVDEVVKEITTPAMGFTLGLLASTYASLRVELELRSAFDRLSEPAAPDELDAPVMSWWVVDIVMADNSLVRNRSWRYRLMVAAYTVKAARERASRAMVAVVGCESFDHRLLIKRAGDVVEGDDVERVIVDVTRANRIEVQL